TLLTMRKNPEMYPQILTGVFVPKAFNVIVMFRFSDNGDVYYGCHIKL
ncbi:MAG: hypothetical protein QG588_857, partial [Candidatus Poribacteria bacterium]|nr:hypothetical protein [Candidatus Poribacteria bacterium]